MAVLIIDKKTHKINIVEIPKGKDKDIYIYGELGFRIEKVNVYDIKIHDITLALESYFSRRERNEN